MRIDEEFYLNHVFRSQQLLQIDPFFPTDIIAFAYLDK